LDGDNETRSPSQRALGVARDMIGQNSTSGNAAPLTPANSSTANAASSQNNSQKQVKVNLFSYVVDAWIKFSPVSTNVAQASS